MITEQGVANMWRAHVSTRYGKLERARLYAVTPDAKRFLVWLWMSCEKLDPDDPAKLFEWSLEKLTDECGMNVLQPQPPAELKAPEAWRDPWDNPLPNLYAIGDLQGQTLLAQRDPMLAEWLKKFAESPYAAASEWSDRQAAVLKKKALSYDADTHRVNVFANSTSSETDKAAFVKNAPPEVVERCRWESRQIEFPTGKNSNLTIQSQIAKNSRLNALWGAMESHEREFRAAAKEAARQQREQAEAALKSLEAAEDAPQPPRLAQRARGGVE